jgi:hypothetical protein
MTHPLEKRWAVTRKRLDEAFRSLQSLRSGPDAEKCFARYRDMLEHNELELALNALEHLAECSTLPAAVWEAFAVAADSMDLAERSAACRKMKLACT